MIFLFKGADFRGFAGVILSDLQLGVPKLMAI